jgi:hypothetical protein
MRQRSIHLEQHLRKDILTTKVAKDPARRSRNQNRNRHFTTKVAKSTK